MIVQLRNVVRPKHCTKLPPHATELFCLTGTRNKIDRRNLPVIPSETVGIENDEKRVHKSQKIISMAAQCFAGAVVVLFLRYGRGRCPLSRFV
jgi:hypothetical protein